MPLPVLQPTPAARQRVEDAWEANGRQSSPGPSDGPPGRAATPQSSKKRPPADTSRLASLERSIDSRAAAHASSAAPEKQAGNGGADKGHVGVVEVDGRCTDRTGGDARVKLLQPFKQPPPGNTVQEAHKLPSLQGEALGSCVTCFKKFSDGF